MNPAFADHSDCPTSLSEPQGGTGTRYLVHERLSGSTKRYVNVNLRYTLAQIALTRFRDENMSKFIQDVLPTL